MQKIQDISLFDILGPEMIGPSSSHTAGACRLAGMARSLLGDEALARVYFTLYGSFARTHLGHGTDLALLAGIMGISSDDIRLREARELAQSSGLDYRIVCDYEQVVEHPNTVDIHLWGMNGGELELRACSVGGGAARIIRINGVDVDLRGRYPSLLIHNEDRPGLVASITRILAEQGINIAFMRLYRERRGDLAFTLVECDESIPKDTALAIRQLSGVREAIVVPAV